MLFWWTIAAGLDGALDANGYAVLSRHPSCIWATPASFAPIAFHHFRDKDGVVLYDGEATAPFGDGLYAVPIRSLWDTV